MPFDMDVEDRTLEAMVTEWLASNANGQADLRVLTEKGGGPRFQVKPRNAAALTITLWVADDGAHTAFGIGGGSWWSDHVPLERASVQELLSAVAAGRAGEAVRRVGGRIVARKGYVELADRRLTYGQINPFSILPGLKWESIVYQSF